MVKIHIRNQKYLVTCGPNLMRDGWYGGLWVRYVGNRTVEKAIQSDYVGFLILGYKLLDLDGKPYDYSDSDTLELGIPNQFDNKAIDAYGKTAIAAGGGEMDFNRNVYDTTVNYNYGDKLYVNNNGILTNVNTGFQPVAIISMCPQDNPGHWLGASLKF